MILSESVTLKPKYQPQASDTCIEAEIIQFNLWRQMQPAKRLALACAATRGCRQLALSGIKKRNPQLDSIYLKQEFIKATLGQEFIEIAQLLETKLVMQDPIWLAAKIGNILDTLSIPYYVGGSIASSAHGEPRSTQDADIAISIRKEQTQSLMQAMQSEFYISDIAVEDALRGRSSSFNVIHLETAIKADIYLIKPDREYEQSQLSRRQQFYPDDRPELTFYICSPEDIILQKLIWYRMSRFQSDKQWRDILGVMKLQADSLDRAYLQHWSSQLNVASEIDRAFSESGLN